MANRTGFATLPYGVGPFGGVNAYPASFELEEVAEGVRVSTSNPKPGDEWAILGNRIERREVGGEWVVVGVAPEDGSLVDIEVPANVEFEYRAVAYQADPTLAPVLDPESITFHPQGVILYELGNPDTVRTFAYKNGNTSEQLVVESVTRSFIGRRRPVVDFGSSGSLTLDKPVMIPFDLNHDRAVQWWRDRFFGHARLCLRDGRGRHVHGSLGGDLSIQDEEAGTSISFTFIETDEVI